MKARTLRVISTILVLAVFLSAPGFASDKSGANIPQGVVDNERSVTNADATVISLSEFAAKCGVEPEDGATMAIMPNEKMNEEIGIVPYSETGEGEHVEITGRTNDGNFYKTIIMPYQTTEDGLEQVTLSVPSTRGSTGPVNVNFRSVNITVVATAYYNGTQTALKPLGVAAYWVLYSSSGTANTVSYMKVVYSVYGATYNINAPNNFTNDVSYSAAVTKYSPSRNLTYSTYKELATDIYFTLRGSLIYGQGVAVEITVNGKSYSDQFAI